jgi:hypothetical protein
LSISALKAAERLARSAGSTGLKVFGIRNVKSDLWEILW